MWYKHNEATNEWYFGYKIFLPNGDILDSTNIHLEINGWKWYQSSPIPEPENNDDDNDLW